jgi:prevent-host-death family protein
MRDSFSLYEAKARLSAIVRMVRDGRTVTITVHGEPAVELRRVESTPSDMEQKLARLEERGLVVRQKKAKRSLKATAHKQGALRRFLAERE